MLWSDPGPGRAALQGGVDPESVSKEFNMCRTEIFLSLAVLGMVCALAGPSAAAPATAAPVTKSTEVTAAKALRERLSKPVTLEKGIEANTPLREALQFISDRYDVTILVDTQAF